MTATVELFVSDAAVTRPAKRKAAVRAFNGESARRVLADAKFDHGAEVIGFTKGQFSFVDLIDGAFESYNKQQALDLRQRFGDENIRVGPNHAKFCLIRNDEWHVVVQTSMNLNQNRRIESFSISDEPGLYEMFYELVSEIWSLQAPSQGFGPAAYRMSAHTLSALGASRTSEFYDVTPGARLLDAPERPS